MRYVGKVQRIGDELGIVFPPDVIERIGLEESSEFVVVKHRDGILLTTDRTFADAMHAYDEGAAKYRNALRALADS